MVIPYFFNQRLRTYHLSCLSLKFGYRQNGVRLQILRGDSFHNYTTDKSVKAYNWLRLNAIAAASAFAHPSNPAAVTPAQ